MIQYRDRAIENLVDPFRVLGRLGSETFLITVKPRVKKQIIIQAFLFIYTFAEQKILIFFGGL